MGLVFNFGLNRRKKESFLKVKTYVLVNLETHKFNLHKEKFTHP